MLVLPERELAADQRAFLAGLAEHRPETGGPERTVTGFIRPLREHDPQSLGAWVYAAHATPLRRFAPGRSSDPDAVRAAGFDDAACGRFVSTCSDPHTPFPGTDIPGGPQDPMPGAQTTAPQRAWRTTAPGTVLPLLSCRPRAPPGRAGASIPPRRRDRTRAPRAPPTRGGCPPAPRYPNGVHSMTWFSRFRRRRRAPSGEVEIGRDAPSGMRTGAEPDPRPVLRSPALSPDEGRPETAPGGGGVERLRAPRRGSRGDRVPMELLTDLRHAARSCMKRPGFAAATVLTLALGIGASTAVFSVVYGVLLKPLPFDDPGRLVSLLHREPTIGVMNQGPATFFTYRDANRSFEAIGAWEAEEATVTGEGDPEQVEVLSVSSATLPLLRVRPVLGRPFRTRDDEPGGPPVALLTHGYWQGRFGGAATAVGQTLEIDGTSVEIVGVLPASFRFLDADPAVVLPMRLDPAGAGEVGFDFQALARLRPGVTLAQANADVARMISLLPQGFEAFELEPYVRPLADEMIGDVGRLLWLLQAAVGIVLLIACGNVTNLFLIRAEGRQRELAMRAALGASRGRIARVLLSESLLLATAGGLLGLVLAHAVVGLLRRIAPAGLPRADGIGIDATVLLFTLALSVLSGVLFGAVAVWKYGAPSVAAIREGGRSASDAPERHRVRNILVVSQVALALTLMIAAGLMMRSFVALQRVHPGFAHPGQVQTFRLSVPASVAGDVDGPDAAALAARTYERIAERLAQVPGVASVGIASSITMDGEDNANPLYVEGVPVAAGALPPLRRFKSFAPGYFETMGIPLVEGRSVTWEEIHQRRPVVVVSAALARQQWGDPANALGRRVRSDPEGPWREVVGVVGDERDDGLSRPPTAIAYWPMLDESYARDAMAFAVRSDRVGRRGFLRELEQAVWSVNPDIPLAAVQTLREIQRRSTAETAFAMTMLALSAGVALLLGIVGIYGVIAYIVTQRTREIGIRIALGAEAAAVRGMLLRHGLRLTAAGIAAGIGASLVLTRVMSALLFGVGRLDPATYAAVSAGLVAVALLATYLPARTVSRIDPSIALRGEG